MTTWWMLFIIVLFTCAPQCGGIEFSKKGSCLWKGGVDTATEAYLLWKDYETFKIQLEFKQLTEQAYRDKLVKRVFSAVFAVSGSLSGCYGSFPLCAWSPYTMTYALICAEIGSFFGYYLGSYLGERTGEAALYLYDAMKEILKEKQGKDTDVLNVNPMSILDAIVTTKGISADQILLTLPMAIEHVPSSAVMKFIP